MAIKAQSSNQVTKITVKQSRQNLPIELGQSAQHFNNLSELWATSPNIVENTDYSSKYYAEKSKESALNASLSETNAKTSEETAQSIVTLGQEVIEEQKNNYISELETKTQDSLSSIDDKAREELSNIDNLAKSYDNLTQRQITNCLLEIPQRIKLDLTDGVLTLKAGSEVIIPNGFESDGTTPKFDYVTVETDKQLVVSDPNSTLSLSGWFTFVDPNNFNARSALSSNVYSGATTPDIGANTYATWYDTANNQIKHTNDKGVTWFGGTMNSLPICTLSRTSGIATSIDRVFNGIGYIGSTVWVDKGVKGLIPDGRNEDGSLKNIEYVTDKVEILDISAWGSSTFYGYLMSIFSSVANYSFTFQPNSRFYTKLETPQQSNATNYAYLENENQWYFWNVGATRWVKADIYIYGNIDVSNGKITLFNPKQPFRAVDYNDLDTKVNKSGDTMTGNLKIQGGAIQHVVQCISNLLMSENPTIASGVGKFQVLDKNGNYLMQTGCERSTDGRNSAFIRAHSPTDWNKSVALTISYLRNGTVGCNFPKCTTKATTTSSARSDLVAVVVQNYVNGTSWYRVWSDGWKEQGGFVNANANTATVTLLKAYSNGNYTITIGDKNPGSTRDNKYISSQTNNKFSVQQLGTNNLIFFWYACGY